MRLLYITSRSADYIQDLTYSGLVKILGKHNVIDHPWNTKFHINYKQYPKNLGYVPHSLLSSLTARFYRNFDAVIVASAKMSAFSAYSEILKNIPTKTPVVFIDGGDQADIGGGVTHEGGEHLYKQTVTARPFDLIFKREYLLNTDLGPNVYPYPISFNFDRLPKTHKKPAMKYDVSFWAVESDPVRTKVLEFLCDKFDCSANGTTTNQKFSKYARKGLFYLQELSSCRVTLNFRGTGWDTLRYWEVPALGRFLISQKPEIYIPNNFIDGESIVYVSDDLSEIHDKIVFYLKNDAVRERIASAARNHCITYHSDICRADYLLSILKRHIK